MAYKSIIGATCACLLVVSFSANSALVSRLGGLAYYDDVADLTWLADANTVGVIGDWIDAKYWASNLEVAGVTGWRLPDTLQPDASCDTQSSTSSSPSITTSGGYNCTGSEMGNLFYNVLGNTAATLSNTGPFINVQSNTNNYYWSATEHVANIWNTWVFDMGDGEQVQIGKDDGAYVWAVHSGDVSAVPVPAAVWLFGSGLIGLIGLARRKASI